MGLELRSRILFAFEFSFLLSHHPTRWAWNCKGLWLGTIKTERSPSHAVGLEQLSLTLWKFGISCHHPTGWAWNITGGGGAALSKMTVTIPHGGLGTVNLDTGGGGSCVMSPSHAVGLELGT